MINVTWNAEWQEFNGLKHDLRYLYTELARLLGSDVSGLSVSSECYFSMITTMVRTVTTRLLCMTSDFNRDYEHSTVIKSVYNYLRCASSDQSFRLRENTGFQAEPDF